MNELIDVRKMSPTQQKILTVLADGEPHRRHELVACIDDPLATSQNLKSHLQLLRAKLRPHGHEIVAQLLHRQVYYRHIIKLSTAAQGNGDTL